VIELLPVSLVGALVAIQPGVIALSEHFLYTASIGFLGLVVLWADSGYRFCLDYRPDWVRALQIVALAFLGALILVTVEMNIYSSQEVAMLKRTIHFAPYNARMRTSLALAYAQSRRFREAEENFREAVRLDPARSTRARVGLGQSLADQGKLWDALSVYDAITDAKEFKPLMEANRKAVLEALVRHYQSLVAAGPPKAAVYYSLGVVYSKQGETARAIENYQHALSLDPSLREAWFNLASTYAAAGEGQKAAEGYGKVIALSPSDDPLRQEASGLLVKIERELGGKGKQEHDAIPPAR
jgi:tetratricopeptide (TPR) repeat protein